MTAFEAGIEQYRHELRVHCYRLLGSYDEAEDMVQETYLRAWRGRDTFEGRSSLRAWLYRIATNVCIDDVRRPRRVLPYQLEPASFPATALPARDDLPWLQPYPDVLLDRAEEPDAQLVRRETIELAFLVAIQHLRPRQRAVLIFRDVLGWSAKDTAAVLDLTVAAVNSALQRARPVLREQLPPHRLEWCATPSTAEEQALLRKYVDAWEAGDPDALTALMHEDVRITMPPYPFWFEEGPWRGRRSSRTWTRPTAVSGVTCSPPSTVSPRSPPTCADRRTRSSGRSAWTCSGSRASSSPS